MFRVKKVVFRTENSSLEEHSSSSWELLFILWRLRFTVKEKEEDRPPGSAGCFHE